YPVAAGLKAGVLGGGEVVAAQLDVVLLAPAHGQGRGVEHEVSALLESRALQHDEPRAGRRGRAAAQRGRGVGPEHEALLRQPEVARRRADDAPDEEVEEDEEEDLEDE